MTIGFTGEIEVITDERFCQRVGRLFTPKNSGPSTQGKKFSFVMTKTIEWKLCGLFSSLFFCFLVVIRYSHSPYSDQVHSFLTIIRLD